MAMTRRDAMKAAAAGFVAMSAGKLSLGAVRPRRERAFEISLAQWSLHRALGAGTLTNLDFPLEARKTYAIDAVEYVNAFFGGRTDEAYLKDLNTRARDVGVKQLLIMCDGEGNLGDPDEAARLKAVDNHRKWLDAAKALGCHSIRVNAASRGSFEEQQRLAADGLRRLCERAAPLELNVIVENHGGLSSNGAWLAGVMRLVGHPRAGTLPDFGNFRISDQETYDRYTGVAELMPFARAVSAKTHEFNEAGDEVHTDYRKMMGIVLRAGYHGRLGIEYEGTKHAEPEGIRLTKALLEKVRDEWEAKPWDETPAKAGP